MDLNVKKDLFETLSSKIVKRDLRQFLILTTKCTTLQQL